MKNNNFTEWLDELKSKTDIVTVISKYITLQSKGRNMWGLCPFHHEKTPSFSVNSDGQFYHCFGCGESGDVISFIQKIEGLDFIDTVKMLGERIGMHLPEFSTRHDSIEHKKKKDKLLLMMREAANYYYLNLKSSKAKIANDYLLSRGMQADTIRKFGIGYSLGFTEIINYLSNKGYTYEMMYETGLIEKNNNRYYDALSNRLIFPIQDMFGNVIAFGGRLLVNNDFAKYKNSKESPIFVKNRTLYGLHLVKKLKIKEKINDIIIVEGYMDAIALSSNGIQNVVASMGTSLTKEQAKILKRNTDKVYIAFDGDAAGQKATIRGLDILYNEGLDVMVISLPEGMDPDDIIKKGGKDSFIDYMNNALPLIEYKLKLLEKYYDLTSFEGRGKYASSAVKILKSLNNNLYIEVYLDKISNLTKINKASLRMELGENDNKKTVITSISSKITGTAYEIAEKYILNAMLYCKDYINYDEDYLKLFDNDFNIWIYNYIKSYYKNSKKTNIIAHLLSEIDNEKKQKLLHILELEIPINQAQEQEYYRNSLNLLKSKYYDKEKKKLLNQHNNTEDNIEKKNITKMIKDINLKINELRR